MRFNLMIRRIETDVRTRCEWVSPEGMGRFGTRALAASGVWVGGPVRFALRRRVLPWPRSFVRNTLCAVSGDAEACRGGRLDRVRG